MTRTSTRRRYLAAGVGAGIAALAGCSDLIEDFDEDEEPEEQGGDEEPVENVNYENPDGTIGFVSPKDGDAVTSPVTIEMAAESFNLQPTEEAKSPEGGAGHLHVIVDLGCLDPGYVIPEEEGYHHLSEGGTETELDLEPGEHNLCAQAGDAQHKAYNMTDEITIEVTEDEGGGNESNDSSDKGLENEENGTNIDDEQ